MTKQIQTVELPEEVEKRFNDFIIKLKAQIDSVTPVMRDDYLHGWTKSFLAKELAQAQQEAVEMERERIIIELKRVANIGVDADCELKTVTIPKLESLQNKQEAE